MGDSGQAYLHCAALSGFPALPLGGPSQLESIQFSFAYSFPPSFILNHSLRPAVGLEASDTSKAVSKAS